MKELLTVINQEYSITATQLQPYGSIWKMSSPQGIFCLKRTKQGRSHLTWLAAMIDELITTGFPGLVPLIPTKSGWAAFTVDNDYYYLTRWVEGSNPDFTSFQQRLTTARLYGGLHAIAQKIHCQPQVPIHNWWLEYQRRTAFLESISGALSERKMLNRVDRAILSWSGHFIRQAHFVDNSMQRLGFDRWLAETPNIGFCHNDPAPRNIIIEKSWFLIDYELSRHDLLIREFATLALRMLRVNRWDGRIITEMLESYAATREPSEQELKYLPFLLAFPHSFWRLCSQRFEEELAWSERHYAARIWEIITEEELRWKFLCGLLPELAGLADHRL